MIISMFENDTWATSAIHFASFDAGFRFDLKLVFNFITVFIGGTADLAKRAKEKSHERFLKQTFDKNSNKHKQRKKLRWKDDNKRENYIFTATLFINSDRCVFSLLLLLLLSRLFHSSTGIFGCVSRILQWWTVHTEKSTLITYGYSRCIMCTMKPKRLLLYILVFFYNFIVKREMFPNKNLWVVLMWLLAARCSFVDIGFDATEICAHISTRSMRCAALRSVRRCGCRATLLYYTERCCVPLCWSAVRLANEQANCFSNHFSFSRAFASETAATSCNLSLFEIHCSFEFIVKSTHFLSFHKIAANRIRRVSFILLTK